MAMRLLMTSPDMLTPYSTTVDGFVGPSMSASDATTWMIEQYSTDEEKAIAYVEASMREPTPKSDPLRYYLQASIVGDWPGGRSSVPSP